ncbi:hypothetical protein ACLOJK_030228 [Asimina triloba]
MEGSRHASKRAAAVAANPFRFSLEASTGAEMGAIEEGEQGSKLGAPVVIFPSRKSEELPSLKLEVEDLSENMSPRNMWQVRIPGNQAHLMPLVVLLRPDSS